MDDLRKKHTTYGFRNVGRRPNSAGERFASSGELLLPGAYQHRDFVEQSLKRPMAYSFSAIDRDSGPKIGHGYGDKVSVVVGHALYAARLFAGTRHQPCMVRSESSAGWHQSQGNQL